MPNRVYIIEDHENLRRMISMALSVHGDYEPCGSSCSGEEAIEGIAEANPSFVLVDLSLPGMSGLDLISEASKRWPHLRCVVLSGHHQRYYAQRALEQGAAGYVLKGNPTEIFEALAAAAEGRTYVSPDLDDED